MAGLDGTPLNSAAAIGVEMEKLRDEFARTPDLHERKKIAEQIQPADFAQLQRVQALSRYRANHQDSSTALGNQQGLIERIEKPSDQPQGHVTVGLRLR